MIVKSIMTKIYKPVMTIFIARQKKKKQAKNDGLLSKD